VLGARLLVTSVFVPISKFSSNDFAIRPKCVREAEHVESVSKRQSPSFGGVDVSDEEPKGQWFQEVRFEPQIRGQQWCSHP
jgi:hypothetical protein